MNGAALRPLSIGEILDGAFTIYRRNFVLLVVTSALLFAPTFALRLVNSQFVYFAVSPLEYKWIGIQWLMYSTVIPYLEAVVTTLYYDLRTRKEGLDVQLAAEAALDVGA